MTRRLLTPLLGTTAFLGGSVVLLVLVSSEAAKVTAEPQPNSGASPPVASLAALAPPWAATAARMTSVAQESKPEVRDPSAPRKADRATRKAVRKALLAAPVEEDLARCIDRDREVWFGGGWSSPEPIPRAQPAILILNLETVGSQVKITDARVKSWGGASRAAVACARDALVGRGIATGSHQAATSMQMTFLLSPRSHALATAR